MAEAQETAYGTPGTSTRAERGSVSTRSELNLRVTRVDSSGRSPEIKSLTPQQYFEAVQDHANQTTEKSLFPGHNFQNLALYLAREFKQANRSPSNSRRPSPQPDRFPFVAVHTFNHTGPRVGPHEYKDPDEWPGNTDNKALPQLLFLRGQPSSKWLSTLGAYYRLDPEFFQRHLDFRTNFGRLNYFSSPALPTANTMLFQLPYVTLGQIENSSRTFNQEVINSMRANCAEKMAKYWRDVNSKYEDDSGLGDSIVRDFYLHDQTHFALEQRMSIALNKSAGSWQLFVWIDSGNGLRHGSGGPWLRFDDENRPVTNRTSFYPNIQTKPAVSLRSHQHRIEESKRPAPDLVQSASLLHLDYGKHLDHASMAADPFYALHEIFLFVAFTQRQYLNMLSIKDSARTSFSLRDPTTSWDSTNLLYDQSVIETCHTHLCESVEFIRSRGGPQWPRSTDPKQEAKAAEAARVLLRHYEDLTKQTEKALARYRDKMNLLMNRAMIAETNKTILQAKEVTKLTRLAFVYIPLSFTASFFGMNVDTFVKGAPTHIWVWFSVSAPIVLISMVLMKYEVVELCKAAWAYMTRRLKNQSSATSNADEDAFASSRKGLQDQ